MWLRMGHNWRPRRDIRGYWLVGSSSIPCNCNVVPYYTAQRRGRHLSLQSTPWKPEISVVEVLLFLQTRWKSFAYLESAGGKAIGAWGWPTPHLERVPNAWELSSGLLWGSWRCFFQRRQILNGNIPELTGQPFRGEFAEHSGVQDMAY